DASIALNFERAASLRDRLANLRWLCTHLERLRHAAERYSFIYPTRGHNQHDRWYLIRKGRVVRSLPRPRDEEAKAATAQIVREVYQQEKSLSSASGVDELDGV